MQVIEVEGRPPADDVPMVLAIGKFDGIHLGHQAILATAKAACRSVGTPCRLGVLTFWPHPAWALARRPGYDRWLTPFPEQVRLLREYGVDRMYRVHFTTDYAATTAEAFVREHLGQLCLKTVVVGADFRFGHGGTAGTTDLAALCAQSGVPVTVVDPVCDDGRKVSSSSIRQALAVGNVEQACAWLGRLYALEGTVVHGDAMGRQLGFPTANLAGLDDYVLPATGVYAVYADIPQQGVTRWPGVMNLGWRPTVGGRELRAEVHLLDFDGDVYGCRLRVSFFQRIRDERKFPDLPALTAQIRRDAEEARRRLQNVPAG